MHTISGYELLEEIQQTAKTSVYRGREQQSQKPVIIKILNIEYPTFKDIARLKYEYEVTKNLEIAGIVKPQGLKKYKNSFFLVLEDFGGKSLSTVIRSEKIGLEQFFNIAIQLSETLGKIHGHDIIHKDIKPQNIIINIATKEVKITDFGISSLLSRENQKISSPNLLEGTLSYMSPEQTGRMNRDIDYRTDFYSLGVTFYEILTGKLPFQGTDPMELIHCHIAKKPVLPHQLSPEIPQIVSEMVMKLLAKTAEDRYQSAFGIKADLEACLNQWQSTGKIENITLGKNDLSEKFQIPQKLYGREQEIRTLMAAFDRVSQGTTEMLLVSGYSGVGKTALISEVHKPIGQLRGHFISGKFEQYERNVPYASLIQAFQELVRQFLMESDENTAVWKAKLLDALGFNGQIIIDVIPEVELLIGKQPPVQALPPVEAQNRFNLVFQDFVRVFTQEGNPLVIFLDDLQWADVATLKLLQSLVTDLETKHLLMIGAYRDNEVSMYHPLMLTLEEMGKGKAIINHVSLQPLDLKNINSLIVDTLHCLPEISQSLSELILKKTGGNAFFINQFLKSLYEEGLLQLDLSQGSWRWNLAQIQAKGITDNVVELMVNKIQKLKVNTQTVLKFAACISNNFDLKTLSLINEKSQVSTAAEIWQAVQEGLVVPVNNTYKLFHDYGQEEAESLNFNDLRVSYRFLHDRVQQAAYSLIPTGYRKAVHFKIGQILLMNTHEDKLEENIFDIINQLNFSTEFFTTQEEKDQLIRLNLIAGKKAKASTAYEPALKYLRMGMALLAKDSWQREYTMTLSLHMECAECEYLSGNFDQAENLFDVILNNAYKILEKAKVYHIKIVLYEMQGKFSEALEVGLKGLKLLGLDLPSLPQEAQILQEAQEVNLSIGVREIRDLVDLPNMTDPIKNAIMSIANNLIGVTYQININLFLLLVLKMVNMSLGYGNSEFSSFGYSSYGVILCGLFANFEGGYEFGNLALTVSEKWNNVQLKSKTNFSLGAFINHWKSHLKNNQAFLVKTFQFGLESGNLLFAGYAAINLVMQGIIKGDCLDDVYKESSKYLDFVNKTKYQDGSDFLKIYQQMIRSLKGLTRQRYQFSDSHYDEKQHLKSLESKLNKLPVHWYFIIKMMVLYLGKHYTDALEMAIKSENLIAVSTGFPCVPEHYFYYSLTLAALYENADDTVKESYWQILTSNQEKMKKWADSCPENYLHKYLLVAAEMDRVSRKYLEAMNLYEQAIESAHEHEYPQNEALANELAANFYLVINKEKIARSYLMDARYGYLKWGATTKVKHLEENHYQLLFTQSVTLENRADQSTIFTSSTTESDAASLDLTSVIKASQAISGEIVLSRLLKKIMKIALENAGAQKGFLILEQEGRLFIEAEGSADRDEVVVLQSSSFEDSQKLPIAVINYVARTRQNLVLNNACHEGIFTTEPYIIQKQLKSLLCMPIINQGKLGGICYLENNLVTGAFTTDRLEILRLLSSQAAISIENARLYTHLAEASESLKVSHEKLEDYSRTLEQKVDERTHELIEKNVEVGKALSKLQQTQAQLVHSEKMYSLGQVVAGVAHEINNPVNFIYGNLTPASEYTRDLLNLLRLYQQHYPHPTSEIQSAADAIELDFLVQDLPRLLSSMQVGAERICQIVLSLRNFTRHDQSQTKSVDIHDGIDSTLLLLQHRLHKTTGKLEIQIIKEYGVLPTVQCYAGQLNQVFMNILTNAIDALEELNVDRSKVEGSSQTNLQPVTPFIWIRTEMSEDNQVVIRIADNGPGMTEEVCRRLFDPFFTTKPVGQGTGLGLSISYQIVVKKHGGQLTCISTPGQGAELIIKIPKQQTASSPEVQ